MSIEKLTCFRCGYVWYPKSERMPKTCPNRKCKSPYWNKPRTKMSFEDTLNARDAFLDKMREDLKKPDRAKMSLGEIRENVHATEKGVLEEIAIAYILQRSPPS